ncbi:hypothetical protein ACTNEF_14300 [Bariatricus sp. HCP28S3_E4]|uniref:MORN repeat-containing protein n=1 Tax=unclassified Bariatricus TaxID=2677046 RepID=UPI003F888C31
MEKDIKSDLMVQNEGSALEGINNVSNEEEIPENEYRKEKKKRKNKIIAGLVCVVIAEASIAGAFSYIISTHNIHKRVTREYQYQNQGFVSTTMGTYSGEMDFGLFDGTGEFLFDTSAVYTGEFENDCIQGLGNLKTPVEGTYEGEFSSGKKEGVGLFTWDDGDSYEGEWKSDKMNGQGVYITANNVIFTGTFENNIFKEGTCEFENETGKYKIRFDNKEISNAEITYQDGTTYSGDCTKSGITGSGTMMFSNMDSYSGEMENDKRSGKGVYTWKSGASYDGDWLNDDMSGTGTYTYSKDNYATGTFEKNIFIEGTYHVSNDFGIYTFIIKEGEPTSVEMTLKNGTKYSGDMSAGKLNGKAQITYSNGDKYSGMVSNNQKSGQGTYEWTSGASYEGEWSEDKMSGTGSYYYSPKEGGYMLTGEFKNGHPNGECTYYVSSSEYYKTDWSNGKCVKVYE